MLLILSAQNSDLSPIFPVGYADIISLIAPAMDIRISRQSIIIIRPRGFLFWTTCHNRTPIVWSGK